MLFVAEYELNWDVLDAVVAKKLEWDEVAPENFRFVGEYVWNDHDPPFRGFAVIETDSVESINAFVLHYGPTIKVRIHAATDLRSAIGQATARRSPRRRKK